MFSLMVRLRNRRRRGSNSVQSTLQNLRIGVDIGGTFTDVTAIDSEGSFRIAKAPSTPPNFAKGVLDALEKLGVAGEEIGYFAHGTTAAINAILTKSGAPTGLITTKGFRDVLELRRTDRGDLFDYWWRPPEPLVLRQNRLEVEERIGFDGTLLTPLNEEDVIEAVGILRQRGIRSVAICFLNSFVNGIHEERAKEIIRTNWPDVYVCSSAEVIPQISEFERTSTTVANAYVGPIMEGYLETLTSSLQQYGYDRDVMVMASSGNVMTIDRAAEIPISTAMSGIAAGVMAGAAISKSTNRPNLLTLDVGGTSSDIALIWDSAPRSTTEWFIEFGVPIMLPSVDIHTIGAGGGSIAAVDVGGVLHVGPGSAGADPGPACYGRGGTDATTTDAQVVLGRVGLDRWSQVYGWNLDEGAAATAVDRSVGEPLGLSRVEAATAVVDVTVNNLVEGIRLVSVQRGYDPRDLTLVAFGGAGPMYAVEIARALEIPEVIIPPVPGVTSALGLLQVDLAVQTQRSVLQREDEVDEEWLSLLFRELEDETRRRLASSGYQNAKVSRQLDVRYFGQSKYLTVPAPSGTWTKDATQEVVESFNEAHEREYGYLMPSHINRVELANARVVAEVPVERTSLKLLAEGVKGKTTYRKVFFKDHGYRDVPVHNREDLPAGSKLQGPAIVEQIDSTTVLPPDVISEIDTEGNMIVSLSRRAE